MTERIEKQTNVLKKYYNDFIIEDELELTATELLCLGAFLGFNIIPGIKYKDNLTEDDIAVCMVSLERKKLYFSSFSDTARVQEKAAEMISFICAAGTKTEMVFNARGGKKNRFFFSSADEGRYVMIADCGYTKLSVCLCKGFYPCTELEKFGITDTETIKQINNKIISTFDKNDVRAEIKKHFTDEKAVNGLYNLMIHKNTCGLFCEYEWNGNNFFRVVPGIMISSDIGSGIINL